MIQIDRGSAAGEKSNLKVKSLKQMLVLAQTGGVTSRIFALVKDLSIDAIQARNASPMMLSRNGRRSGPATLRINGGSRGRGVTPAHCRRPSHLSRMNYFLAGWIRLATINYQEVDELLAHIGISVRHPATFDFEVDMATLEKIAHRCSS